MSKGVSERTGNGSGMESAYIRGRTCTKRVVRGEERAHRGRSARERILTFSDVGRASRRRQEEGARGARATGQSPLPVGSCSIHGYVVREDFPRKTGSVIARRGDDRRPATGADKKRKRKREGEKERTERRAADDEAVAIAATTATSISDEGAVESGTRIASRRYFVGVLLRWVSREFHPLLSPSVSLSD